MTASAEAAPPDAVQTAASGEPLKRVVYLFATRHTKRDRERFGINLFASCGVHVSVVELTALLNPSLVNERIDEGDGIAIDLYQPRSYDDLKGLQPVLSDADFIVCLVGYIGTAGTITLYRLINFSETPYLVLASNAYPGSDREIGGEGSWREIAAFLWKRMVTRQINPLNSLLSRLPKHILGVSAPALIVYGGTQSRRGASSYPVGPSTQEVFAHTADYELFREQRHAKSTQTNTAVYVDEHMGFQRDLVALGDTMPTTPEAFYPKLRKLFDRIELEFGLKIVIAANPRAEHGDTSALFGTRQIKHGMIGSLIATSRLVIGHCSTALSLAVMCRKPVMLIATRDTYDHTAHKISMKAFSQCLAKPIKFFDEPERTNLDGTFSMDDNAYDQYMTDFVKISQSPDLPFWEIVRDAMISRLSAPNSGGHEPAP